MRAPSFSVATAAALSFLLTAALLVGSASPSALAAPATGDIVGTITSPSGGIPDGSVHVQLFGESSRTTTTDANGTYRFDDVPAGAYLIYLTYLGTGPIVTQMYWDGTIAGALEPLQLEADATLTVTSRLLATATITGTVAGAGGEALPSATISATWGATARSYSGVFDPVTGTYRITGLPPGSYRVAFGSTPRWRTAYWDGASSLAAATRIDVAEGATVTGIGAVLTRSTSIGGQVVMDDDGVLSPFSGYVTLWPTSGANGILTTSLAGRYDFYDVPPGTYRLCFGQSAVYVFPSCWGGGDGDVIAIVSGAVLDDFDGVVTPGGAIDGTVQASEVAGGPGDGLGGAIVRLSRWDAATGGYVFVRETYGAVPTGGFGAEALQPGHYLVQFLDPSGWHSGQYWEDARYVYDATEVEIVGGATTHLGTIVLDPRTLDVGRIAGADRFAVGAAISQSVYPTVPADGVPVVYVANGLNFPDALSAGPAASIQGGVVLLVLPEAIPASVAAELERLDPQRIVVVGGPASVSPTVFTQLAAYVDSPADVVRQGGADRFAASRSIVADAFEGVGADFAIIATGHNFPDALAAGPAAAAYGAPVILVDGWASGLDLATRQLLEGLGVTRVYIAGGTASVRFEIERDLALMLGGDAVTRFAGVDRFDAAAQINAAFFDTSDFAFVTTGLKFPDAMTGGPLAAAYGAPLFLTLPGCLPSGTAARIFEQQTQGMVILGGTGSVEPAVEGFAVC